MKPIGFHPEARFEVVRLWPVNNEAIRKPCPPSGTQEWAASNVNIQDG